MVKVQTLNMQTGEITESDDGRKETTHTIDESMIQLRMIRNDLLAQSDWMTFSDSPTMSDEWKKYRQELRDITKGLDSVAKVVEKLKQDKDGNLVNFPTKPS